MIWERHQQTIIERRSPEAVEDSGAGGTTWEENAGTGDIDNMNGRLPIRSGAGLLLILIALEAPSAPQIEVLSEAQPQQVFAANGQKVTVRLRNHSRSPITIQLTMRLLQVSSATVAPVQEVPWQRLVVLPEQTVCETGTVDLPGVTARTRFLIQWVDSGGRAAGTTELLAYPANLLAELTALSGVGAVGVFDPTNELKPLLRQARVEFENLPVTGIAKFTGAVALIGPFDSHRQMPPGLRAELEALAKRGTAVVWMQPPTDAAAPFKPSFYRVPIELGNVIVAHHDLTDELAKRPGAQWNLLRLIREALHPAPLVLPETEAFN